MLKVAAIQLNSGEDIDLNLKKAEGLIRKAAASGAQFVATPENTPYMGTLRKKVGFAESSRGKISRHFSEIAKELQIHLLLGSFCEIARAEGKCRNTSLLFGPDGKLLSRYSKIHLFDVAIPGKVDSRESDSVIPGKKVVVSETGIGRIGHAICFDLRFPSHFQALRGKGVDLIVVPSAFTAKTGKDHWEVLLRARAIENQTYVIAPAQVGLHGDEGLPESYGHAMILDPWGRILAERKEATPGVLTADLNFDYQEEVRRGMPLN